MATYLAGLYRSLRFGAEEAHGRANLIQLNWLRTKGAIELKEGKLYIPNEDKFMAALEALEEIFGEPGKVELLFRDASGAEALSSFEVTVSE